MSLYHRIRACCQGLTAVWPLLGVAALVAVFALAVPLIAFWSHTAEAATERYDYDPLGRLIRHVDPGGEVTEYEYDPVGNITRVRQAGNATALVPTVSNTTPTSFRKGTSTLVTVTGTNFSGARLNAQDPNIDITGVSMTATQLSFTASANVSAEPGLKAFSISNAAGSANFNLTLAPTLPVVSFSPQPIALPPDNSIRNVSLVLSNTDTVSHTVALSMDNTAVATVSPASVVLAPGQSSVLVQITGKAGA